MFKICLSIFMGIQAFTIYFITFKYIVDKLIVFFVIFGINGVLKCIHGFSSFSHSNQNISSL
jgi:hypothetical protein